MVHNNRHIPKAEQNSEQGLVSTFIFFLSVEMGQITALINILSDTKSDERSPRVILDEEVRISEDDQETLGTSHGYVETLLTLDEAQAGVYITLQLTRLTIRGADLKEARNSDFEAGCYFEIKRELRVFSELLDGKKIKIGF